MKANNVNGHKNPFYNAPKEFTLETIRLHDKPSTANRKSEELNQ